MDSLNGTERLRYGIEDLRIQVGRLKYQIRRQADPDSRRELLDKAFQLVHGKEGQSNLLSHLLVLRARHHISGGCLRDAKEDAQNATELTPHWGETYLVLADALEASGQKAAASEALIKAQASKRLSEPARMDVTVRASQMRRYLDSFTTWSLESTDRLNHNYTRLELRNMAPVLYESSDIWHVDVSLTTALGCAWVRLLPGPACPNTP